MKKILILLLAVAPSYGLVAQDVGQVQNPASSPNAQVPGTMQVPQEAQSASTPANGDDTAITAEDSNTQASMLDLGGTDQNKSKLRLGWLDIHPHFDYTVNYDDNIYIASTNEVADFQHTISPGVLFGAGDYNSKNETYMTLDYTPSIILFQENSKEDAVQQNVDFEAQYKFNKLTLGLRQGYQYSTGPDVQVGNRVDRNLYPTQIKANYEISPKTSVDGEFSQIVADYKSQFDNTTWKLAAYGNYKPTEKITLGIGPTVGWRDIQANPNQSFQQVNGRVIYEVSQKISIRAKAGVGFRQTENGYSRTSPVFSLGGTWTPIDGTLLSLDAYREEYSSTTLTSQNYYATGFSARIKQRFLQKFYIGIGGGYENSEYYATSNLATPTNRIDNYFYIRPSFDYQVTDFWSVGAFYFYRQNDSTTVTNGFFNNQAGIETSLAF